MERFVTATQAQTAMEDPKTTVANLFSEEIARMPTPALKDLATKWKARDYGTPHRTAVMMLLRHRELVGPNCGCSDCRRCADDEEAHEL